MATSTAQAYRETPGSASENLSPFRLKHLVRYSGIPLPQRHLILAALEVSQDAGVVIWSSVRSLSVETKMSERTIYHRRRRMLKLGLWERIRDPYTWDDCPKCGAGRDARKCACGYEGTEREFRRPPTFRLRVERIASWPRPKGVRAGSYKDYKASPEYPGRKSAEGDHRSTYRSSASNEGAKQEVCAPQPIRETSGISRAKHREMQFRQELGIRMAQLMRGVNRNRPPEGGMGHRLGPGDEGYVAPLTREEAECAVAREFGSTPDEVADHLKLMHWKFAEKEQLE